MSSARDRILDAYEELLALEGERYATLDAVAAKANNVLSTSLRPISQPTSTTSP